MPMTTTAGVSLLLTGTMACVLLSGGCVRISADDTRYVETEERTFPVNDQPELDVDLFDGPIEIDSWDRPEIRLVAYKRGVDPEAVRDVSLSLEQQGGRVVVRAREADRSDESWGFRGVSVRLVATVPRGTLLRLESGDGRIAVHGVDGRIVASTADGGIRLEDVGAADVKTADGSIRIAGRLTDVRARTADGSVSILADEGSQPAQDWTVTSNDGAVVVQLPPAIDADIDAYTGDGHITVRELGTDRRVRGRATSTFRTRLNNGGPTIRVRTDDGSITFRGY
jgi:hypothetical protein